MKKIFLLAIIVTGCVQILDTKVDVSASAAALSALSETLSATTVCTRQC